MSGNISKYSLKQDYLFTLSQTLRQWHLNRAAAMLRQKARAKDFAMPAELLRYLACVEATESLNLLSPRGQYILAMWQMADELERFAKSCLNEEITKRKSLEAVIDKVADRYDPTPYSKNQLGGIGDMIIRAIIARHSGAWWIQERYVPDEDCGYQLMDRPKWAPAISRQKSSGNQRLRLLSPLSAMDTHNSKSTCHEITMTNIPNE